MNKSDLVQNKQIKTKQVRRKNLCITAISGNEEKWAKQWSTSVMRCNPSSVVVNLTQYNDNTEKILRDTIPSNILTIVKNPWEKDFSKARNQGLAHVPENTDYCMYLDMDEVFTEESYSEIEKILTTYDVVIGLITIYNSLDQEGLLASLFYPRLWPAKYADGRKTKYKFEGTVHNQLSLPQDIPVVRLPICIMHYGYALGSEEMSKKHKRSEELLREQIRENNDSFFSHLNLAQLLRAKGEYNDAFFHASEVMRIIEPKRKNGDKKYDHAAIMACEQMATCCVALKKAKESIEYSKKVLEIKSDHLDSLFNLGNAYLELRDYNNAEFWYKRYLFIRSKYNEMRDNTNLILNHLNSSFLVLYNLGVVKALQGDMKNALDFFKKSYEEQPDFRDVFIKYIHTLRMVGKMNEMYNEINKFMSETPKRGYLVYEYLGDMELESGNVEIAKFNLYNSINLTNSNIDDAPEKNRISNKWENIKYIFGDVSSNFFETKNKKNEAIKKVSIQGEV